MEDKNKKFTPNRKGWNTNTTLGCDLKTVLRRDRLMKPGRDYQGVLRRDVDCEEFRYDEHFTFVENSPVSAGKRNPRVYDGVYITITRREDGSLHPNFKEVKQGKDFNAAKYATAVGNELLWAFSSLIDK